MRGEKRWIGKEILWWRIFSKRSSLRKVVIASRAIISEPKDEFQMLEKHHLSVTAIALAEDDSRDFSASKDGIVMHWDVESGKSEKYLWPSEDVLVSHNAKPLKNSAKKSKNVLSLAVSSDGRLLASGGWTATSTYGIPALGNISRYLRNHSWSFRLLHHLWNAAVS